MSPTTFPANQPGTTPFRVVRGVYLSDNGRFNWCVVDVNEKLMAVFETSDGALDYARELNMDWPEA